MLFILIFLHSKEDLSEPEYSESEEEEEEEEDSESEEDDSDKGEFKGCFLTCKNQRRKKQRQAKNRKLIL